MQTVRQATRAAVGDSEATSTMSDGKRGRDPTQGEIAKASPNPKSPKNPKADEEEEETATVTDVPMENMEQSSDLSIGSSYDSATSETEVLPVTKTSVIIEDMNNINKEKEKPTAAEKQTAFEKKLEAVGKQESNKKEKSSWVLKMDGKLKPITEAWKNLSKYIQNNTKCFMDDEVVGLSGSIQALAEMGKEKMSMEENKIPSSEDWHELFVNLNKSTRSKGDARLIKTFGLRLAVTNPDVFGKNMFDGENLRKRLDTNAWAAAYELYGAVWAGSATQDVFCFNKLQDTKETNSKWKKFSGLDKAVVGFNKDEIFGDDPSYIHEQVKLGKSALKIQDGRLITESEWRNLFWAASDTNTRLSKSPDGPALKKFGIKLALTKPETFEGFWTDDGKLKQLSHTTPWSGAQLAFGSAWNEKQENTPMDTSESVKPMELTPKKTPTSPKKEIQGNTTTCP